MFIISKLSIKNIQVFKLKQKKKKSGESNIDKKNKYLLLHHASNFTDLIKMTVIHGEKTEKRTEFSIIIFNHLHTI